MSHRDTDGVNAAWRWRRDTTVLADETWHTVTAVKPDQAQRQDTGAKGAVLPGPRRNGVMRPDRRGQAHTRILAYNYKRR